MDAEIGQEIEKEEDAAQTNQKKRKGKTATGPPKKRGPPIRSENTDRLMIKHRPSEVERFKRLSSGRYEKYNETLSYLMDVEAQSEIDPVALEEPPDQLNRSLSKFKPTAGPRTTTLNLSLCQNEIENFKELAKKSLNLGHSKTLERLLDLEERTLRSGLPRRPSTLGCRRKVPGGVYTKFSIDVPDCVADRFKQLAQRLQKKQNDTLCYLLDLEEVTSEYEYEEQLCRGVPLASSTPVKQKPNGETDCRVLEASAAAYVSSAVEEELNETRTPAAKERGALAENGQTVEVKFSLPKSTWQRYVRFFQIRQRRWMNVSHGEKLKLLLDMAEKTDDYLKTIPTPKKGTSEKEPHSQSALSLPLVPWQLKTPPKNQTAADQIRNSTSSPPLSFGIYDSFLSNHDCSYNSGKSELGYEEGNNVAFNESMSNNEGQQEIGNQAQTDNADSLRSRLRIPNAVLDLDSHLGNITERYTQFFQSQGWSSKTPIEKMGILVDLAETHPDLGHENNAIEQSLNRKSMSIGAKYENFFASQGYEKETYSSKLKILLDLAETHPKIRNVNTDSSGSSTQIDKSRDDNSIQHAKVPENQNRNQIPNHPMTQKSINCQSISSSILDITDSSGCIEIRKVKNRFIEPTRIVEMHLDPQLFQRYLKFFLHYQWPSTLSDTERIAVLIELAETHPKSIDTSQNRSIDNFELLKSNIDEAISKAKFWLQKVGNRLGSFSPASSQTSMLRIPLMISLWQRYSEFFDTHQIWIGVESDEQRLAILLELAETHPGLQNLRTSGDHSSNDTLIATSTNPSLKIQGAVAKHNTEPRSRIRHLSITVSKSIGIEFDQFFEINRLSSRCNGEKLGILLGLAETHPTLADDSDLNFDFQKATSECRVPCYQKIPDRESICDDNIDSADWKVVIEMTPSLWTRYSKFFSTNNWTMKSDEKKLALLVFAARTHPVFDSGKKMLWQKSSESDFRISTSKSLFERCDKFFDFHGFATQGDNDKLDILLDLAESHQSLVSAEPTDGLIEKISTRRKRDKDDRIKTRQMQLRDFSDDSDGSWNDGSKPKKQKPADDSPNARRYYLSITMPLPLRQRYKKFFESIQWDSKHKTDQMSLLIMLAETHPDLNDGQTMPPLLDLDEMKAKAKDCSKFLTMSIDFRVGLTQQWRQRYATFFEKQGWASKSSEAKIDILLESAETHPAFFESDREERPRFQKSKFPSHGAEEEARLNLELKPKNADNVLLPLLAPDYFMKFSKAARFKRPFNSRRTYAAMANTRRYIVEWRQLKQLVANCLCTHDGCHGLIDCKSVRVKQVGYVIILTAHCCNSSAHIFTWASSAKVRHEKNTRSSIYVLNVAIPAAVQMSGNNFGKLQHFALTSNLCWSTTTQSRNLSQGSLMPVVKKCFEMTQREMLQKLKSETSNGQLVLAGDGQYDSPGRCATLCTYTLMALGVEENHEDTKKLKHCGYVVSQTVIDRRHADNKSVNMERVGLHWALQPIIKAGIKVAELVTDEHVQILSDFKKIGAAAEEQAANEENGDDLDTSLTAFKESLSTALLHVQPPVDAEKDAMELLSFYSAIVPSNDIWHKAKNLLKSVSGIAQTASAKEQQCYRKYAKMLKNYLWECAEGAQGSADVFIDLWTTAERHLKGDHDSCSKVDLHSKTKLMDDLDQQTRSFAKLIACLNRITSAAEQLCRFRNTGILESYNGLTLKYCPKRIGFDYDVMTMRKELAALDHNHHVLRPYRKSKEGGICFASRYKKSTKGYSLRFQREEKNYDYLGHLMAAVLLHRCETDLDYRALSFNASKSASHPTHIQRTIAPFEQTKEATCKQWLSKKKAAQHRIAAANQKTIKTGYNSKKRIRKTSLLSSDDESDESGLTNISQSNASDDEWSPRKCSTKTSTPKKSKAKKKRLISLSSDESDKEPEGESNVSTRPRRIAQAKKVFDWSSENDEFVEAKSDHGESE